MTLRRVATIAGFSVYLLMAAAHPAFAFGKKHKPEPAPPPPVAGPVHGSVLLRVLTYNVHGLPLPGIDQGRYADIGRILGQRRQQGTAPQIAAFQEAFDDRTQELVDEAKYPYGARGKKAEFLKLSSGLLAVSEFAIAGVDRMTYDDCVSWDCFARKGALHMQIVVPGVPFPVEFYDTHMNSDPDTDPVTTMEQTRSVRLRQTGQLRDFIATTSGGGLHPVIFPGDFNIVPDDPGYLDLQALLGMRDALQDCATSGRCTGDGSAPAVFGTSVDHQLFTTTAGGIQVQPVHFDSVFTEPVNGRMLSDHIGQEIQYLISW